MVYSINITLKADKNVKCNNKREIRDSYKLNAKKRSNAYRIRSPFHHLQIRTNFPLIAPSLPPRSLLYLVRPIRLYITQNLIPKQTRRKFWIIPGETSLSRRWYHPHLCVSLLLPRPIVQVIIALPDITTLHNPSGALLPECFVYRQC